jgi:hypothetical protein
MRIESAVAPLGGERCAHTPNQISFFERFFRLKSETCLELEVVRVAKGRFCQSFPN